MDQKHKFKTGNIGCSNRSVYQNLNKSVNHRAYGSLKTILPYSVKDTPNNKILEDLPDHIRQRILTFTEEIYFNRGEFVFQPDDTIRFVYLPENAIFSEFQILEDGKTIEVAMIGCEGIVGFSSVFNSRRSPNWSQISIPGKALRINAEIFRREFQNCESLQKSIFSFVNFYIAQISQRVICASHHLVEERLCCWLSTLRDRCESDRLEMTQEQMARILGVHRPSVTLITKSLRDKKIINYRRGKIFIRNRAELENLACACYENIKLL